MNVSKSLVSCLLIGCASAQQTWVVDMQNDPGTHFLDFPPAVAAASPGDTIRVVGRPGVINYTMTTIDKPLRVVGMNGSLTGGANGPGRANFAGRMVIENIPAGEQFLLSNMVMVSHEGPDSGLWIRNCDGVVLIEDVQWTTGNYPEHQFLIDDSENVTLRDSYVRVWGTPLRVVDSQLLVTTCIITQSGSHYPWPFQQFLAGAPGLDLTNSTATVIGSGVDGAGYFWTPSDPQNAQPAVRLTQSTLRVGVATSLRGGGDGYGGRVRAWSTHNFATNSVVELDPRTYVNELTSSWMFPAPTHKYIHAAFHGTVVANRPYGVSLAGPPSGFGVLAVGNLLPSGVPTPFGKLWLDSQQMHVIDIVPLPWPYGRMDWVLDCPASVPGGFGFVFQGLTVSPSGELGLTEPSPFTVAWEPGIPW